MSVASSSSLRILRSRTVPLAISKRRASTTENPRNSHILQPYSPNTDTETSNRPARPSSALFFTGRPVLNTEMENLQNKLTQAQNTLRTHHIYPLPVNLEIPPPPEARWKPREDLAPYFGEVMKVNAHRRVTDLLNDLNRTAYLAELGGRPEVSIRLQGVLKKYLRTDRPEVKSSSEDGQVDVFGRALGAGRRKEAHARVWIIPSRSAAPILDGQATEQPSPSELVVPGLAPASEIPSGEILINHIPLPIHFPRPQDREAIMRPLRLTGLLGAYNIFGLVEGGGSTGQAGAVALALARALVIMRDDVKPVLYADGALMRDPRVTERKKTGKLKARKARTWVKR